METPAQSTAKSGGAVTSGFKSARGKSLPAVSKEAIDKAAAIWANGFADFSGKSLVETAAQPTPFKQPIIPLSSGTKTATCKTSLTADRFKTPSRPMTKNNLMRSAISSRKHPVLLHPTARVPASDSKVAIKSTIPSIRISSIFNLHTVVDRYYISELAPLARRQDVLSIL